MKLQTLPAHTKETTYLEFTPETPEEVALLNELTTNHRFPIVGRDAGGNVMDICFIVPKK